MGKAITQHDVAKMAGVSRSIVSYVLNDGPRGVAPETKARILDAIETLGYRPNKFARNLQNYESLADKQLGVVLSDVFMFKRPYYADILAGIYSSAHQHKYHIRFLRVFSDFTDPVLFNELIHEEEVSGLLLIALDQSIHSELERALISRITERIQNIVCVEWEFDGLPSINLNRQEAAYKAAAHLVDLGYRDICYIGPADKRVAGYRQLFLERGLMPCPREPMPGVTMRDGAAMCDSLLAGQNQPFPEAFLGGTDEVCMGILSSLHRNGIAVPNGCGVIGIDNIEMSQFMSPPLTTVSVDTYEMGRIAVETLLNRAANPGRLPTTTFLPTKLIIRESCPVQKA